MTVREQLAAWGIDVERLLDVDLDADQFDAGRDPQVQAWCCGLELEVHAFPPPHCERHAVERVSLGMLHAAERAVFDRGTE